MIFPRQKLYDVNLKGFFFKLILGNFNKLKKNETEKTILKKLRNTFSLHFGFKGLLLVPMGRVACYFAVKYSITKKRKKIIICPFTIFDMINMIRLAGGTPHFVDSVKDSPHLSLKTLKANLTKDTAAVIITHYHNTNPEIKKIHRFCKYKKIKIIEDCAISLGSKRVSLHPDFALFSFGLFKFISSFYGGGIFVKSKSIRKKIDDEISNWSQTKVFDVFPAFLKGLKFYFLTRFAIFNYFTFPLFKFGFLNNINFVKKMAINDPNPFLRKKLPKIMKKRLSIFQLEEILRQIPKVKNYRLRRIENAFIYFKHLNKNINKGFPNYINKKNDCYLNFPLIFKNHNFYSKLMINNFDTSRYYYRNCANLDIFKKFSKKKLKNLQNYVDQLIVCPNYSVLPRKYIVNLTKFINMNLKYKND